MYLERVERDLANGDRGRALANLAELGEISRRLWNTLAEAVKQSDWRAHLECRGES